MLSDEERELVESLRGYECRASIELTRQLCAIIERVTSEKAVCEAFAKVCTTHGIKVTVWPDASFAAQSYMTVAEFTEKDCTLVEAMAKLAAEPVSRAHDRVDVICEAFPEATEEVDE